MGEDKALLDYNGQKFIEKIAAELSFFDEKMIARGKNIRLTKLEDSNWKEISDIYPNHGPIGGLHAALKQCESEAMFVVTCDMPLITEELAKRICKELTEQDDAVVVVTSDGKYHPLCGLYHKRLCDRLEEQILQNHNRVMKVLENSSVRYVHLDEKTSAQLTNVNTKKEYGKIFSKK